MRIRYTRHAEDQIRDRKLEKVWVEETIKRPQVTNREGQNKYYVSKKLNGLTIEVVYVKEKYKVYKGHYSLSNITMKIKYDPDADAIYIKLSDEEIEKTRKIDENTIMDYDKNGKLVGIELLFVKERMPHLLREIQVENLMPT